MSELRWNVRGVTAELAAGGAVLLLQMLLQPGTAISNGVAAIQLT